MTIQNNFTRADRLSRNMDVSDDPSFPAWSSSAGLNINACMYETCNLLGGDFTRDDNR